MVKKTEDKSVKISPEAIYQEIFHEMRRYRDYELTASTWYTTILLAILGYVFTSEGQGLLIISWVRVFVSVLVIVIGFSGIFSVEYAHRRYAEIREHVSEVYKDSTPKLSKFVLTPYTVIQITLLMLVVFNIGILLNSILISLLILLLTLVFNKNIFDKVFTTKK